MNAQLDIFEINYTLERKIKSWESITPQQLNNELSKVCVYLFSHPRSSSREISEAIKLERTSVCRVLASNKKYFNTENKKICNCTNKTVTAYELSQEGLKYYWGQEKYVP